MTLFLKNMITVLGLITGSQAMEEDKFPFGALPEENLKIRILAEAAPNYCYKDGHAGNLASVCKDWNKLINLPALKHPLYKTSVSIEEYCLFNIFKTLKLIYKPNEDDNHGIKEFYMSDTLNSSGEFESFDIKDCGNDNKFLKITPGYKKVIPAEKDNKIHTWIVLRSEIAKELKEGKAKHLKVIFEDWEKSAPIGIFFTHGISDDIYATKFVISKNFESISKKILNL